MREQLSKEVKAAQAEVRVYDVGLEDDVVHEEKQNLSLELN